MALERSWLPPPCSRRDGMDIIRLSRHLIITAARRNVAARRLQAAQCDRGAAFFSEHSRGRYLASQASPATQPSRTVPVPSRLNAPSSRPSPARCSIAPVPVGPQSRLAGPARAGWGCPGRARESPRARPALTGQAHSKKPHPCDIAPVRYGDSGAGRGTEADTRAPAVMYASGIAHLRDGWCGRQGGPPLQYLHQLHHSPLGPLSPRFRPGPAGVGVPPATLLRSRGATDSVGTPADTRGDARHRG